MVPAVRPLRSLSTARGWPGLTPDPIQKNRLSRSRRGPSRRVRKNVSTRPGPISDIRREYQSTIDGLAWERDLAAGVQFLRQQAIIDVRVSRRRDLRLAAETHPRSIPIFQLARLAVDNIALQGRSAAGWQAIVELHSVSNRCSR